MSYWTHWFSNFRDARAEGVCKISEEQKLGEIYSKYGIIVAARWFKTHAMLQKQILFLWSYRVRLFHTLGSQNTTQSVSLFSNLPFVQVEPHWICFLFFCGICSFQCDETNKLLTSFPWAHHCKVAVLANIFAKWLLTSFESCDY